jgi:hypothetical protein
VQFKGIVLRVVAHPEVCQHRVFCNYLQLRVKVRIRTSLCELHFDHIAQCGRVLRKNSVEAVPDQKKQQEKCCRFFHCGIVLCEKWERMAKNAFRDN